MRGKEEKKLHAEKKINVEYLPPPSSPTNLKIVKINSPIIRRPRENSQKGVSASAKIFKYEKIYVLYLHRSEILLSARQVLKLTIAFELKSIRQIDILTTTTSVLHPPFFLCPTHCAPFRTLMPMCSQL